VGAEDVLQPFARSMNLRAGLPISASASSAV
jgi:hypothetical protein